MKRRMHVDFIVDIMILDDLHKMRLSLSLYETKIRCLRRNEIFDVKLREDGQLPTRLYSSHHPSQQHCNTTEDASSFKQQMGAGGRRPAGIGAEGYRPVTNRRGSTAECRKNARFWRVASGRSILGIL